MAAAEARDTHMDPFLVAAAHHVSAEAEGADAGAGAGCGVGRWRPRWLQPLASKKAFVATQGCVALLLTALNAYFIGTLSTLERRFRLPSVASGAVAAATDAGFLLALPALGYAGGRGSKPRFLAAGALLGGAACLLFAAPHAFFGAPTPAHPHAPRSGAGAGAELCGGAEGCSAREAAEAASAPSPAALFAGANALLGFASAAHFSLSVAYLDDNSARAHAPFVLALSLVLRMLGPTVGFAMASFALSHYVDPALAPDFSKEDPRWVGAWWMGYVVFGAALCLLAPALLCFPAELPRVARRKARAGLKAAANGLGASLRDFRNVISRLLCNRIYMLNTFGSVFYIFGLSGLWNFMPKYMETLFAQSASRASFIMGSAGLGSSALGVLLAGLVIARLRPRPRALAAWNVVAEALDVLGYGSWAFLGCPVPQLHGAPAAHGSWNLTASCNAVCNCGNHIKYAPICDTNSSTTYFSPCHAGCSSVEILHLTKFYSNCSCFHNSTLIDGACKTDCADNFIIFITIQSVLRFLQATGKTGNLLIQLRCVCDDDKPMSIAFMEFIIGCLVYIPAPIVYGALLDSSCLIWGEDCEQKGNCWFYDGFKLRYLMNFVATGCIMCALAMDVGVWYLSESLEIYDDKRREQE